MNEEFDDLFTEIDVYTDEDLEEEKASKNNDKNNFFKNIPRFNKSKVNTNELKIPEIPKIRQEYVPFKNIEISQKSKVDKKLEKYQLKNNGSQDVAMVFVTLMMPAFAIIMFYSKILLGHEAVEQLPILSIPIFFVFFIVGGRNSYTASYYILLFSSIIFCIVDVLYLLNTY